jgi:hypothetical protein
MSIYYFVADHLCRRFVKSNDENKYSIACDIINELSDKNKYVVLKGFFHDSVVGKINPRDMLLKHRNEFHCIVNPDSNRKSLDKAEFLEESLMFFKNELQTIFSLDSRLLTLSNCSLLFASTDCAEQRLHCDFDYQLQCSKNSFVCFVGIETLSHIIVLNEHTNSSHVVRYGPGDLLVLRGDCVHAGGYYQVEHLRPHFYAEKLLGNGHRLGRKLDAVYFYDRKESDGPNPLKKKQYGLVLGQEKRAKTNHVVNEQLEKAREEKKRKRELLSL